MAPRTAFHTSGWESLVPDLLRKVVETLVETAEHVEGEEADVAFCGLAVCKTYASMLATSKHWRQQALSVSLMAPRPLEALPRAFVA